MNLTYPKIMTNTNSPDTTTIKLQCPADQVSRWTASAQRLGMSRNKMLVDLLNSFPVSSVAPTINQNLSGSGNR